MKENYSNSLCMKCDNDICKVYGGRCRKYNIVKFFKRLFCKHKNSNEVVCWHWVHYPNDYEIRSIEAQLRCNDCGKYHFLHIYNWNECDKFIAKHKDKQWSKDCQPVL